LELVYDELLDGSERGALKPEEALGAALHDKVLGAGPHHAEDNLGRKKGEAS
jgi:hypothetical protein